MRIHATFLTFIISLVCVHNAQAEPWEGDLLVNGQFTCTVTVLNESHTLTYAHCVDGRTVESLRVRVPQGEPRPGVTRTFSVANFIQHENYSQFTGENDIAVIRLESSIEYTDQIQPVQCITATQYYDWITNQIEDQSIPMCDSAGPGPTPTPAVLVCP